MKKIFIAFLLLPVIIFFFMSFRPPSPLSKRAFDQSIGLRIFGKKFILHRNVDRNLRKVARSLIERRTKEGQRQDSIPNKIHQIWPYNSPLPDHLARCAQTVKKYNQDATYRLWTKDDFAPLLNTILDNNWQTLSPTILQEIAAACILWQEGGLIVDLECECVSSFCPLLSRCDCLVGLEPPLVSRSFQRRLALSSIVLGASSNHPLIQKWITEMLARLQTNNNSLYICQDALTTVFVQYSLNYGRALIVGPTYFCPIAPNKTKRFQKKIDGTIREPQAHKLLALFNLLPHAAYSTVAHETVCIHISGGRYKQSNCEQKTEMLS